MGPLLALGWVFFTFLLDIDDPRLEQTGVDFQWKGRPATALVYGFFGNHKLKTVFLVWRGQRVGTEYIWHDNGQLMAQRSYSQGIPDGVWKLWHEDGSAKSLKTYKMGLVDGTSWAWHGNGQISDFNLYVNGQEVTHKSWISDGTPYYNYVYQDGRKVGMKGGEFCKRLEVLKK